MKALKYPNYICCGTCIARDLEVNEDNIIALWDNEPTFERNPGLFAVKTFLDKHVGVGHELIYYRDDND